MEYKVGKRAAKWLHSALRAGADPGMPYSVISVLEMGGRRFAGATDGNRLHAVEVAATVDVGPYVADIETGLLSATIMEYGAVVDWAVVVPHDSDLTRVGLQVDEADHVNIAGNVCYKLLLDGSANVKCGFVDDAVMSSYNYIVRCNCKEYGPIKIEFLTEQTARFAVLLPIRVKPIKPTVYYT